MVHFDCMIFLLFIDMCFADQRMHVVHVLAFFGHTFTKVCAAINDRHLISENSPTPSIACIHHGISSEIYWFCNGLIGLRS